VKAHLYDSFVFGSYNTLFVRRFTEFLTLLAARLEDAYGRAATGEEGIELVQVMSAILLPGILPGLFRKSICVSLSDGAARALYVEKLIQRYFSGPFAKPSAARAARASAQKR
jgi:hypothetical protein